MCKKAYDSTNIKCNTEVSYNLHGVNFRAIKTRPYCT